MGISATLDLTDTFVAHLSEEPSSEGEQSCLFGFRCTSERKSVYDFADIDGGLLQEGPLNLSTFLLHFCNRKFQFQGEMTASDVSLHI